MKIHLATADWPLTEGSVITALCDEQVAKAAFASTADSNLIHVDEFVEMCQMSLRLCRKCAKAPLLGKYLYAVTSGEEAKQAEAVSANG
jgi:hypothetical protein